MPKRRYKAKKRRIGRRRKSFFKGFLFPVVVFSFALVLSGIGFILFSPRFQITDINVAGNSDVSADQVKQIASASLKKSFSLMGMDFSTESIFLSAAGGVSGLLKTFPQIESVSIKKDFPNGLSVQVVEKTPFAVWCQKFGSQKCFLVDKSGSYIKDYAGEAGAPALKINEEEDISALDRKSLIGSILNIEAGISPNILTISDFGLYNEKLIIDTAMGCQLIFILEEQQGKLSEGDKIGLDWEIEKLNTVLKNESYAQKISSYASIDLRYGSQAVLKKK